VVALVVAFVAAITNEGTPLKAIQLLWVNLIMDTMAALALGTEAPTKALLNRPPSGRNYPLISAIMWRNIFIQSAYQLTVLFVVMYAGHYFLNFHDETERNTFIFNAFVFCQIFNEINSRRVGKGEWNVFSGLFSNWIFIGIIVITAVVQAIIIEFGSQVFRVSYEPSLSWENWGYSVAIGAFTLVVGGVARLIPVPDIWCCAIKDGGPFIMEEEEDDEVRDEKMSQSETSRLLPG